MRIRINHKSDRLCLIILDENGASTDCFTIPNIARELDLGGITYEANDPNPDTDKMYVTSIWVDDYTFGLIKLFAQDNTGGYAGLLLHEYLAWISGD